MPSLSEANALARKWTRKHPKPKDDASPKKWAGRVVEWVEPSANRPSFDWFLEVDGRDPGNKFLIAVIWNDTRGPGFHNFRRRVGRSDPAAAAKIVCETGNVLAEHGYGLLSQASCEEFKAVLAAYLDASGVMKIPLTDTPVIATWWEQDKQHEFEKRRTS